MPFENTQRETRLTWLGEASAMLLADELNARGLAAITRDERVQAFDQLHLPVAASLSRATVIKVGQLVGASEVIVGSFRLEGDELIVEAHSIRIEVGRLESPITERAPLKDFFGIYERLRGACPGRRAARARRCRRRRPAPSRTTSRACWPKALRRRRRSSSRPSPRSPGFDQARLALWDVRTEQGDHAAALAAVKPVPATSPFAARRPAADRAVAARVEGLSGAAATFTRLIDPADPEDDRAATGSSRAGAQRSRRSSSCAAGPAPTRAPPSTT